MADATQPPVVERTRDDPEGDPRRGWASSRATRSCCGSTAAASCWRGRRRCSAPQRATRGSPGSASGGGGGGVARRARRPGDDGGEAGR